MPQIKLTNSKRKNILAKADKLDRAKLDVPLERTNWTAWRAELLRQRAGKGKGKK